MKTCDNDHQQQQHTQFSKIMDSFRTLTFSATKPHRGDQYPTQSSTFSGQRGWSHAIVNIVDVAGYYNNKIAFAVVDDDNKEVFMVFSIGSDMNDEEIVLVAKLESEVNRCEVEELLKPFSSWSSYHTARGEGLPVPWSRIYCTY